MKYHNATIEGWITKNDRHIPITNYDPTKIESVKERIEQVDKSVKKRTPKVKKDIIAKRREVPNKPNIAGERDEKQHPSPTTFEKVYKNLPSVLKNKILGFKFTNNKESTYSSRALDQLGYGNIVLPKGKTEKIETERLTEERLKHDLEAKKHELSITSKEESEKRRKLKKEVGELAKSLKIIDKINFRVEKLASMSNIDSDDVDKLGMVEIYKSSIWNSRSKVLEEHLKDNEEMLSHSVSSLIYNPEMKKDWKWMFDKDKKRLAEEYGRKSYETFLLPNGYFAKSFHEYNQNPRKLRDENRSAFLRISSAIRSLEKHDKVYSESFSQFEKNLEKVREMTPTERRKELDKIGEEYGVSIPTFDAETEQRLILMKENKHLPNYSEEELNKLGFKKGDISGLLVDDAQNYQAKGLTTVTKKRSWVRTETVLTNPDFYKNKDKVMKMSNDVIDNIISSVEKMYDTKFPSSLLQDENIKRRIVWMKENHHLPVYSQDDIEASGKTVGELIARDAAKYSTKEAKLVVSQANLQEEKKRVAKIIKERVDEVKTLYDYEQLKKLEKWVNRAYGHGFVDVDKMLQKKYPNFMKKAYANQAYLNIVKPIEDGKVKQVYDVYEVFRKLRDFYDKTGYDGTPMAVSVMKKDPVTNKLFEKYKNSIKDQREILSDIGRATTVDEVIETMNRVIDHSDEYGIYIYDEILNRLWIRDRKLFREYEKYLKVNFGDEEITKAKDILKKEIEETEQSPSKNVELVHPEEFPDDPEIQDTLEYEYEGKIIKELYAYDNNDNVSIYGYQFPTGVEEQEKKKFLKMIEDGELVPNY